jgi:hypothetical protein
MRISAALAAPASASATATMAVRNSVFLIASSLSGWAFVYGSEQDTSVRHPDWPESAGSNAGLRLAAAGKGQRQPAGSDAAEIPNGLM